MLMYGAIRSASEKHRKGWIHGTTWEPTVIDRKIAADLYLNLLVPWETIYKALPQKGNFDIRSKGFIAFKRENQLFVQSLATRAESHDCIKQESCFGSENKQILIFQKGDNSRARSLIKHLRNAVAHACVENVRIKNRLFLVFEARRDGKTVLKGQIYQARLGDLIAALKSTIKHV